MRRLWSDTSGNIAVTVALAMPVLVGAAGLGTETTFWYYRGAVLQAAADASAYAAQAEKLLGSGPAAITAAATTTANANGLDALAGTATVETPPSTGPNAGTDAVEVILREQLPRLFTALFSDEPVTLSARAVARADLATQACLLALDPRASRAATFSGSAAVQLRGCAVMANSAAADAVRVQGSATLDVDCLISAGGVDIRAGALTTDCPRPLINARPVPDPFRDLVPPSPSGPCRAARSAAYEPGVYCNGMNITGDATLAPGVYVVSAADFRVGANARVAGTGVTIYLACRSEVQMNGTATVQLSAPDAGPYAGVLFYGDRSCIGGSHTFNGTADSLLTGAMYFARQAVSYLGNFSGLGGCSQVVAGTVEWSGNASVSQDCTTYGMRDIPAAQRIRLVE